MKNSQNIKTKWVWKGGVAGRDVEKRRKTGKEKAEHKNIEKETRSVSQGIDEEEGKREHMESWKGRKEINKKKNNEKTRRKIRKEEQ